MGTGRHSVQVEGPGDLPIGISKQHVGETGLQHVQGQERGLLHHLEKKGPREMRTPGGASTVTSCSSSFGSLGPLRPSELQVNGVPRHFSLRITLRKQCSLQLHYNDPCAPPQGYMQGSEAEGRKEPFL